MGWREKRRVTVEIDGEKFVARRVALSDLGSIKGLDTRLAATLFADHKKNLDDAERLAAEMPPEATDPIDEYVKRLEEQKNQHEFFAQFAAAVLVYPEVTDFPSDDTITVGEIREFTTAELVAIFNASTGVGQTAPFRNGASEAN